MPQRTMKYNPAFLTEEELVQSFVVREADLELIVDAVRENVGESNQHLLVIGPRGMGKTMLVLRAVAEVRRDEALRDKWYPLVFAEESYEVTTPGEFWLEALFHLWHQTKDDRWGRTYEDLRREPDEMRLRERALAQLMDFADALGKRVLLVVENLNMLLGDQISHDDAWVLRHTLQHEPRVMMLASATTRFDEVENSGKAMFEVFKPLQLKPLTEDECRKVWVSFTGQDPPKNEIRPIQILTGGSPRLLAIISSFAAGRSFNELMNDLTQLVDDHTEYFKTHLDNLAPIERKVYLALAEIWDPATARSIAEAARLNVNMTSSLLQRLVSRGAVVVSDARQRTKWYQVAERLYNIYYLMRRRGSPSSRVRAVVNFMVSFYGEEDLIRITRGIAEEALKLDISARENHYLAYESILRRTSDDVVQAKILPGTPRDFLESPEAPPSLRELVASARERRSAALDQQWGELIERTETFRRNGNVAGAEQAFREVVELQPDSAPGWGLLGMFLHMELNRYAEAEEAYRKAIALEPDHTHACTPLVVLLIEQDARLNEGVELAEKFTKSHPEDVSLLNDLAWVFYCTRLKVNLSRAEAWAREAVRLSPGESNCQHTYACILCAMNKGDEALASAEKYFNDAALVSQDIDDAIELGVQLAVAGVAREAVNILQESPSAAYLEPLIVGLKVFLGEEVRAAAEILEVGRDVAKRISERKGGRS